MQYLIALASSVALFATTASATAASATAASATPGAKVQVYIMMGQSNMLGEGKIGSLTAALEAGVGNGAPQHDPTQEPKKEPAQECAPESWWANVTFRTGRHGMPTKGGYRVTSPSEADCCAQCLSKNLTFWTYMNSFTNPKEPAWNCWLFNLTAQNETEADFFKQASAALNFTAGSVNPLPPKPHFKPPKPPPPPPSNTLALAVAAGKYPYLYDAANKSWTTSATVRNVFTMGGGGPCGRPCDNSSTPRVNGSIETNSFMNGGDGHHGSIGPELGIGAMLEQHSPTTRIMLLKSCIGNRALGWDLLPPTQKSFDWTDPKNSSLIWTYAGYHQSPARWEKGTTPVPIGWQAGLQYDGDLKRADDVLADFGTYYPGATNDDYEIAGFFWWQGDRDSRDPALSAHYEDNLAALIKSLRLRYNVPNAPFVTASLGQSTLPVSSCTGNCGGEILQAMMDIADPTKHPEFKGTVGFVDSHPLEHTPGSSGGHYGHDALTYMNVGEAMGEAMVKLLDSRK